MLEVSEKWHGYWHFFLIVARQVEFVNLLFLNVVVSGIEIECGDFQGFRNIFRVSNELLYLINIWSLIATWGIEWEFFLWRKTFVFHIIEIEHVDFRVFLASKSLFEVWKNKEKGFFFPTFDTWLYRCC